MTMVLDSLLTNEEPGTLCLGGARMALLDIEAGFWGLRRQLEALAGRRLTDVAIQQAGASGGASFARSFAPDTTPETAVSALRHCIAAYQAAGFGHFKIESVEWPLGRVLVQGTNTFESWMVQQHQQRSDSPICAYTAGVLVGFINALTGRHDVVCVEHTCQAQGAGACQYELMPAEQVRDESAVVTFNPDPLLNQQLNLLETLFDRMPMGIAILDRELRLRRCNPTWADFIERYTPSSVSQVVPGAMLYELIPGSEANHEPVFQRVLAGETVRLDAFPLESGGILSYWDVAFTPLAENGQVVGILDVVSDATPRVQALQELEQTLATLREREERLDLVMRGTNDGIWDWNLETNEVYYSPRWKAMLGYEEHEIRHRYESWRQLVHPDDLDAVLAAIQAHLKGETPLYQLEHRLRHKDGSYRWILARGIAVRDADGTPYRMAGSHSDITDQRQTEEALRYRLEFENLITKISTKFINLPPDEIDAGIEEALQMLGQFADVDQSYVFLFSEGGKTINNTHEWCTEGIESRQQYLQSIPASAFAWSGTRLRQGEALHIPQVAHLPPEAEAEKQRFQEQGIQSLVAVPMTYQGTTTGFLGLDSIRTTRSWSDDSIALLTIVGEIFVSALQRQRAQKIQAGQRQFLELLASGRPFSETLHTLVQVIEEQSPGMLGLILLLDEDGKHLHHGAAVSLPEEYTQSIEGLEIGPMVGSCGTASYLGERVIVEDIAQDPRWDGLRNLALKYGLRACWSEPVTSTDGQVLGTFAMYYRHPRSPTRAELDTIETAAHLAGVAMERKRSEEALQESQRTLTTLMSNLPGMAYRSRHDRDRTLTFVSEGSFELTGYRADDLIDNRTINYGQLIHPQDRTAVWNEIQTALDENKPFQLTYRIRTAAGEKKWVWEQGRGVYSATGGLLAIEGFATDISERVMAQQRLEQRVQERTRELTTLLDVSHNVASTLELEPLLDLILDQLKSVVDYDGASIMVLNGEELRILAHHGPISQKDVLQLSFSLQEAGANAEVIRRRQPVIIPDVRADTPLARAFQKTAGEQLTTTFAYVGSWMGVPLIVKDRLLGMLSMDHSQRHYYQPSHSKLALAFANQVAVTIENARLFAQTEQHSQELEALYRADDELYRHLRLENVLQALVDVAVGILGADKSSLMVWDSQQKKLNVRAARGFKPETMAQMSFAPGEGVVGQVFDSGKPAVVEETRLRADVARKIVEREGISSFMHVPIEINGRIFGVFNISYNQPRAFGEQEQRLFSALAQRAALVIENARLYERAQEAAAAEERNRLARELHDAVTQTLFSASLIADVLPRIWSRNPEQGQQRLEELRELTRGALAEMRTLLLELRPSSLTEVNLGDLLRQLTEATIGRSRLPVDLTIEGEKPLPPEVQVALYRIAQESLNNITKHAGASQVTIDLCYGAEVVELSIRDNGRGFDPEQVPVSSLGMGIMRERAHKIGATLNVDSQIGEGTQITVIWPVATEHGRNHE